MTICLTKLYAWRRPQANGNTFVSMQHRKLYMETYVCMFYYCCWQDKFAIEALLCNTQYNYIVDSDVQLNNTHRMHCYVSTAAVVTRTRNSVILYAHCLSRCNIWYLLIWRRCGFNNNINNDHLLAVALEEINQKTGIKSVSEARLNVSHYTRWKNSKNMYEFKWIIFFPPSAVRLINF
jgi:hypothetical protein